MSQTETLEPEKEDENAAGMHGEQLFFSCFCARGVRDEKLITQKGSHQTAGMETLYEVGWDVYSLRLIEGTRYDLVAEPPSAMQQDFVRAVSAFLGYLT